MAASDYVTPTSDLVPGTKARADDVNEKVDAINAGFDLLPIPRADSAKGFDEIIKIPDPVAADDAATRGWVEQHVTDAGASVLGQAQDAANAASASAGQAATSETNAGNSETAAAASAVAAAASAEDARQTAEDQLIYRGEHDATTGAPTPQTTGDLYEINVAGKFDGFVYEKGDHSLYNGTAWKRLARYSAAETMFFGG